MAFTVNANSVHAAGCSVVSGAWTGDLYLMIQKAKADVKFKTQKISLNLSRVCCTRMTKCVLFVFAWWRTVFKIIYPIHLPLQFSWLLFFVSMVGSSGLSILYNFWRHINHSTDRQRDDLVGWETRVKKYNDAHSSYFRNSILCPLVFYWT